MNYVSAYIKMKGFQTQNTAKFMRMHQGRGIQIPIHRDIFVKSVSKDGGIISPGKFWWGEWCMKISNM